VNMELQKGHQTFSEKDEGAHVGIQIRAQIVHTVRFLT